MSNAMAATYAEALYELCAENGTEGEILDEIKVIGESLSENGDFLKVLNVPSIRKSEKLGLIDSVFGKDVHPYLINCMKVMVTRGDSSCMTGAFEEFENLYNKAHNIEKAVAVTAVPLTDAQKEKLTKRLSDVTGKTVLLENRVDESVIGGVVLKMDEKLYDDSIKTKLSTLSEQLKNN